MLLQPGIVEADDLRKCASPDLARPLIHMAGGSRAASSPTQHANCSSTLQSTGHIFFRWHSGPHLATALLGNASVAPVSASPWLQKLRRASVPRLLSLLSWLHGLRFLHAALSLLLQLRQADLTPTGVFGLLMPGVHVPHAVGDAIQLEGRHLPWGLTPQRHCPGNLFLWLHHSSSSGSGHHVHFGRIFFGNHISCRVQLGLDDS